MVEHPNHAIPRVDRAIQWTCATCGRDVADDGVLHVNLDQARAHRHAVRATRSTEIGINLGDLLARPAPARWAAHHSTCDLDTESNDYWIPMREVRSHAQLLRWTAHLMGKNWLADTDWIQVIRDASVEGAG